jgi:hypothetical protein
LTGAKGGDRIADEAEEFVLLPRIRRVAAARRYAMRLGQRPVGIGEARMPKRRRPHRITVAEGEGFGVAGASRLPQASLRLRHQRRRSRLGRGVAAAASAR